MLGLNSVSVWGQINEFGFESTNNLWEDLVKLEAGVEKYLYWVVEGMELF